MPGHGRRDPKNKPESYDKGWKTRRDRQEARDKRDAEKDSKDKGKGGKK